MGNGNLTFSNYFLSTCTEINPCSYQAIEWIPFPIYCNANQHLRQATHSSEPAAGSFILNQSHNILVRKENTVGTSILQLKRKSPGTQLLQRKLGFNQSLEIRVLSRCPGATFVQNSDSCQVSAACVRGGFGHLNSPFNMQKNVFALI